MTVRLCVKNGQIALYASTTIPTPNRALNTFSFENGLLNAECEDIFVDPKMLVSLRDTAINRFKDRKRQVHVQTLENITLFVTIEGLADNSSFTLETPAGNSSICQFSVMHSLYTHTIILYTHPPTSYTSPIHPHTHHPLHPLHPHVHTDFKYSLFIQILPHARVVFVELTQFALMR